MLPFSKQPLTYDTRLFMDHKYAIDVSSVFVTEQHGFVVPATRRNYNYYTNEKNANNLKQNYSHRRRGRPCSY